jgi:hypothetical protein
MARVALGNELQSDQRPAVCDHDVHPTPEHPIASNPDGSEDVEVDEHPIENADKPLFEYLQRR